MRLNFKLESENGKLPTKHTKVAAGIDFYAAEGGIVYPWKALKVSTGVSWKPTFDTHDFNFPIPCTIGLILQSRSGIAFNKGLEASNAGVVDVDYFSTPEKKAIIHVKLYNTGWLPKRIKIGDKICQGVLQLIPICDDIKILDSDRQSDGFGSSDKKDK